MLGGACSDRESPYARLNGFPIAQSRAESRDDLLLCWEQRWDMGGWFLGTDGPNGTLELGASNREEHVSAVSVRGWKGCRVCIQEQSDG